MAVPTLNPSDLQITFFQFGEGDHFADGWVHEKTVPYGILAQAIRGEYEVTCEEKTIFARSPQAFLTPPNRPLRITHHGDRHGGFASRWIHFSCTLHGAIDLCEILEMPMLVESQPGRRASRIMDELSQTSPTLVGAMTRQELIWSTLRLICEISRLLPGTADLLKAGKKLEPLISHLRTHLADEISVDQMTALARMSASRLFAFFRERLGCTPQAYLKRLRLDAAAAALVTSDAPLKQIAGESGFANPFHLSREFSRRFGMAPRAFRQIHSRSQ